MKVRRRGRPSAISTMCNLVSVISACLLLLVPSSINSLAASSKKKARAAGGGGFGGAGSTSSKSASTGLSFTADTSATTTRLMDFLKAQKSEISNVAIGLKQVDGQEQRGLFATKNFAKKGGGQILCKIPSDCALALSDPAQQGKDAPTVAHGGANLWNMYLQDAQKQKLWAPYLDTLPGHDAATTPTPDFLSADELQLLEFPRIIQNAQERNEQIQKVSQETGISLDDLRYATWLVSSRALPLSMATDDETMAEFDDRGQVLAKANRQWIRVLVPLLDMVNHQSENPNAKWTILDPQKDNAWFALESLRPISAGQEITMAYGSGVDSSVELYQNYGIVLPPSQPRHFIDSLMLKKGGDDCLASVDDWTTTLQEDESMLEMLSKEEADADAATVNLRKILAFRIKLKQAYTGPDDE